ncbi:hypothetical protein QBC39DRAFT_297544 [Podospora conica]|nr:hypothetical protein QBC39DRAFT_297544 [Schizothecium conicum]
MTIQTKPIPALYTVYILRSTVRHSSLYIGSTPNPPRRLSQHNGVAKGGAARTSKAALRPWEMVGLVSGFPSMVAALKFEWALTNPHLSLHIPSSSRLTQPTQRRRGGGKPRRPIKSVASIISNLHLLLRVPSFERWPLKVHFFAPEVYRVWVKWCETTASEGVLRAGLEVVTDFGGEASAARGKGKGKGKDVEEDSGEEEEGGDKWGIHALPVDYEPIKEYVAKGQEVFVGESEGRCVVCREELESGKGLHVLCSSDGCEGVGHLACWSRHLLPRGDDGILPVRGRCPKCDGEVQWVDMMKELTLRLRGKKEVESLLKVKKKRAVKGKATAKA